MTEPVIISLEGKTKNIGSIDYSKRLYWKLVKNSKHLLNKHDAWAIDSNFFHSILVPQNFYIQVNDIEDHIVYQTTAEEMSKNGGYFNGGKGNGLQFYLERKYWKTKAY